jgi:NAD(P)-dependent dehydrogenase (short-subunit alcohol dehydrogenase family)
LVGGSKGIGKGVATAFALAGAGNVVICARSQNDLDSAKEEIEIISPGTKVLALAGDITSPPAVDSLFNKIASEGIVLDLLVNNAGIMGNFIPITESDPTYWSQELSTHVNATYLATRAFLKQLSPSVSSPTIINTSSLAGVEPSLVKPGSSAYCVGKFAVLKLTEFVAIENPSVRVFAYHPGGVMTDLVANVFPPEALKSGFWSDTPELAGGYCLWMSSPRGEFMRGRYGSVNWDVQELEARRDEILEGELLKMVLAL